MVSARLGDNAMQEGSLFSASKTRVNHSREGFFRSAGADRLGAWKWSVRPVSSERGKCFLQERKRKPRSEKSAYWDGGLVDFFA